MYMGAGTTQFRQDLYQPIDSGIVAVNLDFGSFIADDEADHRKILTRQMAHQCLISIRLYQQDADKVCPRCVSFHDDLWAGLRCSGAATTVTAWADP